MRPEDKAGVEMVDSHTFNHPENCGLPNMHGDYQHNYHIGGANRAWVRENPYHELETIQLPERVLAWNRTCASHTRHRRTSRRIPRQRFSVKRCSRCHMGISANELVMRAKELVYHLSCFTCASCNKALTPGEHFGMKENMVYCRTHYEFMMQGDYLPPHMHGSPGLPPGLPHGLPPGSLPFYNGVGAVQKGRPRKRKSPAPDLDGCPSLGLSEGETDLDGNPYPPGTGPRTKRMRTSFKHHQLRTMKSYFALNHNPDAKDLKQLAQKTGLTKRVLQVWFQNARAKYRRNLLRQEQKNHSDKSGQLTPGGESINTSNIGEIRTSSPTSSLSDISTSHTLTELHDITGSSGMSTESPRPNLEDLF
ncbi:PREDICTED: LIM/homeobox protein Lhx9-like [Priapulus caudatus]|uniref:LIM/homeobox protein Lhx9-like n=1 Tax=Priapulus caudatus TaxID=37621 RepID=A0ABM1DWW5_PRICU|nr:PREDICTED: LIM/homeobox protein Lhx9-like [Priapulus caudatus]